MTTRTPGRAPLLVGLAAAMALAGCANVPIDKRTQGQVVGGVAGAALGSTLSAGSGRIVATGAGAVLGALAGGSIADGM